MRDLLLNKIALEFLAGDRCNPNTMRWKGSRFSIRGKHFSKINWFDTLETDEFNDGELIDVFEIMVRQNSKQM